MDILTFIQYFSLIIFLIAVNKFRNSYNVGIVFPHLYNKVILITGTSSGIGQGLFKILKNYNVELIICSSSDSHISELENYDELHSFTACKIHVFKMDLSDPNSIEAACLEISSKFKSIDIVINNAGMSSRGSCLKTHLTSYRKLFEINYFGQIFFTQKLLQLNLISKINGILISVGSIQSHLAIPDRSAYASTKFALLAYFDSLRAEIKRDYGNVRVITIHPSYVSTNLSLNAMTEDGGRYNKMDENTANGMPVEYVAQKIIETTKPPGIFFNCSEVYITNSFKIKIALTLRRLYPEFIFNRLTANY